MRRVPGLYVWAVAIVCFSTWMVQVAANDESDLIAKQLLLQAVQLGTELTPPGTQIDLYGTIAEEFAAMGVMSDATKLATYFDVKRGKDDVLLWAVRGSIRAKGLDQGIELANLITGEYEQGQALAYVALAQAEGGHFLRR